MSCYYTLCIWDPESEDEVPVMFNIGSWLTVQAAMLEQFEGYSMEYIVELRPDSIWIYNSGDDRCYLKDTLKYRKKKITPPWEQEGGDAV